MDAQKPMDLPAFTKWAGASNQRHMRIISDWAQETKPNCQTLGQWRVWMKRHLRAAVDAAQFTDEQLQDAYEEVKRAKRSYLKQYTLETVLKYLTGAKA